MRTNIFVSEPLLKGNELKYVTECIETGWISSEGPFVNKFEDTMANYVGRKYGVAVCNGTVALELAVKALELEEGAEIILPSFTIISCATAIVRNGCVPVLVDSDPLTWNMDVGQIEGKITKKTKAIMVVHIYGLPVDMDPIIELAHKYNLFIIEDAAEMHGQTYKGKKCGSFGDISVFSFYPNKLVTTGEGGMLLTDDPKLAEKCRYFRNLCFKSGRRFVHDDLGYNFRMTNIQAAIGLAQLEQIEEFVLKKRAIGAQYKQLLSSCSEIQLPVESTNYADNIYWVYGIVLKNKKHSVKIVTDELNIYGIGTRPFFWPMHHQPVFQNPSLFEGERYPHAEFLAERGFYLPSGLTLEVKQIEYVADTLISILKK